MFTWNAAIWLDCHFLHPEQNLVQACNPTSLRISCALVGPRPTSLPSRLNIPCIIQRQVFISQHTQVHIRVYSWKESCIFGLETGMTYLGFTAVMKNWEQHPSWTSLSAIWGCEWDMWLLCMCKCVNVISNAIVSVSKDTNVVLTR